MTISDELKEQFRVVQRWNKIKDEAIWSRNTEHDTLCKMCEKEGVRCPDDTCALYGLVKEMK